MRSGPLISREIVNGGKCHADEEKGIEEEKETLGIASFQTRTGRVVAQGPRFVRGPFFFKSKEMQFQGCPKTRILLETAERDSTRKLLPGKQG